MSDSKQEPATRPAGGSVSSSAQHHRSSSADHKGELREEFARLYVMLIDVEAGRNRKFPCGSAI